MFSKCSDCIPYLAPDLEANRIPFEPDLEPDLEANRIPYSPDLEAHRIPY
jgi:hypothetical protein